MAKVAWLGLGVMGFPMAGHLAQRGGHNVTVYNRTAAKANAWVQAHGMGNGTGQAAATPAAAARDADVVCCCVGNDDDLRSVTVGPGGAFSAMQPGAVFVDHTTASAKIARELSEVAKAKGLEFLDCPVSGGQAGAQAGTLTIMCGGDDAAYKATAPLMENFN